MINLKMKIMKKLRNLTIKNVKVDEENLGKTIATLITTLGVKLTVSDPTVLLYRGVLELEVTDIYVINNDIYIPRTEEDRKVYSEKYWNNFMSLELTQSQFEELVKLLFLPNQVGSLLYSMDHSILCYDYYKEIKEILKRLFPNNTSIQEINSGDYLINIKSNESIKIIGTSDHSVGKENYYFGGEEIRAVEFIEKFDKLLKQIKL